MKPALLYACFACVVLLIVPKNAAAQRADLEANRAELSRPVFSEKTMMAHMMANVMPPEGVPYQYELYDPDGPSSNLGGLFQTKPFLGLIYPNATMEEYALHEMRAAKMMGIDAFSFFWHGGSWRNEEIHRNFADTILAFFRAAEKHDLDFKFNICPTTPGGPQPAEFKIRAWGKHMRRVYQATKDSPHWLRTPDGRLLWHLWAGERLATEVTGYQDAFKLENIKPIADAYEDLATFIGADIAYIYHIRGPENPPYINKVLDYFPAVWTFSNTHLESERRIRRICEQRGRHFSEGAYPDMYTSKVYDKATRGFNRLWWKFGQLEGKTVDELKRRYRPHNLSRDFRLALEELVQRDADSCTLVTWNDFMEGHHLAPEVNHNFGYGLLLEYYTAQWKGEEWDRPELAITFYKKYTSDVTPSPFDYHLFAFPGRASERPPYEDNIEVVTILDEPGEVFVNGRSLGTVGAGLKVSVTPSEPGPVHVQVKRSGETFIDFTPPEWITDQPFRTDLLTYAYSSQFDEIYRQLYPADAPVIESTQYVDR